MAPKENQTLVELFQPDVHIEGYGNSKEISMDFSAYSVKIERKPDGGHLVTLGGVPMNAMLSNLHEAFMDTSTWHIDGDGWHEAAMDGASAGTLDGTLNGEPVTVASQATMLRLFVERGQRGFHIMGLNWNDVLRKLEKYQYSADGVYVNLHYDDLDFSGHAVCETARREGNQITGHGCQFHGYSLRPNHQEPAIFWPRDAIVKMLHKAIKKRVKKVDKRAKAHQAAQESVPMFTATDWNVSLSDEGPSPQPNFPNR